MNFLVKKEMINELLLATILSTSFSVRTPNDDTKPLDYEFSVRAEKNEGNFTYNMKRDWERELGTKYIDDVVNFQHSIIKYVYYGVDYVNKESKNIDYITYNVGADIGYLKAGVAFQEIDEKWSPLLDIGLSTKADIKDLDDNPKISYIISVSIKSNIVDNNIINVKSEVKKWLSKRVNIYGLYKHEYYNEKEDFQFKVGLGIKL